MSPPAGRAPASWLRKAPDGLRLAVRVTPRAANSAVSGIVTDAAGREHLIVRLQAPPADGKANALLTRLLAKRWGIARGTLHLVQGAGAREKLVFVAGEPAALKARISAIEGGD